MGGAKEAAVAAARRAAASSAITSSSVSAFGVPSCCRTRLDGFGDVEEADTPLQESLDGDLVRRIQNSGGSAARLQRFACQTKRREADQVRGRRIPGG